MRQKLLVFVVSLAAAWLTPAAGLTGVSAAAGGSVPAGSGSVSAAGGSVSAESAAGGSVAAGSVAAGSGSVPAGSAAGGSVSKDYAQIAMDIMPAGEYGTIPAPPGADREARMYDALTPLFGNVHEPELTRYFKPDTIGDPTPGPLTPETVPHPGVTIIRDVYDIPHIHGVTRDDVTWGAGWVVAEDRSSLLQQARYDSRLAAIDAPGQSALNLIVSLQSFKPSAQTEATLANQTKALLRRGRKGREVLHDIDVYIQGINAYIDSHGHTLGLFSNVADFTRNDIYALNALKGQFVGQGGGQEAARSEFLSALERRLGKHRGYAVWQDFREANDPEAPTSVPGNAHFEPPPRSTKGNVILDSGSLTPSNAGLPTAGDGAQASNILMVSGARSITHHPLMVAGPQIGFDYPGLVQEMELDGPGIHERGAMSANFPGYIFIGRSQDAAWTLTSAGLDIIDTYVETLCGHSRIRYLYKGRCRAMKLFDAGSLSGKELTFYRTVHGPVIGYARVHGRPVAVTRKRSSYGRDAVDLLFYHDLAHGLVRNAHQFIRAASQTPQTFNSFYMDDKEIGVFTSGLIPIRPRNVDPALPTDGRGHEEWRGWVPARDHPQGINPPSGVIINWNNRLQGGYEAPDDNWSLGGAHRVRLLIRDLGRRRRYSPANLVAAMNMAATQDVREENIEPLISKVLRTGKAPSRRAAEMLRLLNAWHRHGGSRLDRTGNGQITDPGAAIMDAAWPGIADAWASSVLGPKLRDQLAVFDPRFDEPWNGPALPTGREQTKGWHIYMSKDLRSLLAEKVRGPLRVRYCGGGNLRRCRRLLWAALNRTGAVLAAQQGPNPIDWRSDANRERINFAPLGLNGFTLRYTNRPSGFQQILSFFGHASVDRGR